MGLPLIAGYQIEGRIGAGGMGEVFRARAAGGAVVALKVLDADRCPADARLRFAREGEIAASLRHPNLVRVLDSGERDGRCYLAMELLEGEDLRARLRRGTLPVDQAVRVGRAAAAGLGAAHDAGIVHRDVKPANLFLCTGGRVKVCDFGLALSPADAQGPRLTVTGRFVGTPGYMAIEQAMGLHNEDVRTDVWGLGATLYRAVAGRRPFQADSPVGELVRLVHDPPDPLPARVPAWLASVIARALEKDKAQRWPTMADLGAALEAGGDDTLTAESSDAGPRPLGHEVRIVAVLLAEQIGDPSAFEHAVRAEHGEPQFLFGGRAVGVFGGHAWRGDEAERAVCAGLAVRAADSAAHLGVATGRGVRMSASPITGAVVGAAEQALAERGVGVDPESLRRIRGGFDAEGSIVTGRRRGGTVGGYGGIGGADTPLLGREPELADLEATLQSVLREARATGVLVTGPAGIGKSRLWQALRERLAGHPEIACLEARAEPSRVLNGWELLATAVRGWLGIPASVTDEDARSVLLCACPSRDAAEFLGEAIGLPFEATAYLDTARSNPDVMRDRIVLAFGDFLEQLTADRPVVLALEDLQWADEPSIDAIEIALQRLEGHRLLVVATARADLDAPLPDWRRLTLGPLSRAATRALVGNLLDAEDATRWAEAIAERSGGNPFFAEELALAVAEQRPELPASVEIAIQERLDRLSRPERDTLRRAAVLGRTFWVEGLTALGEAQPVFMLGRLRRREFVSPEPRARLAGAQQWRFRNALVQEVALRSLTDEMRTALHRAAAAWLSSRPDGPWAEVAHHRRAAGDVAGAVVAWVYAAERAARHGDSVLALQASEQALQSSSDERTNLHLRAMRADMLLAAGRVAEHDAEVEALERIVQTESDRRIVCWRSVRVLRVHGRHAEAMAACERFLARFPDDPNLLVERAAVAFGSRSRHEAVAAAEDAERAAAHAGDHRALGRALMLVALCRTLLGDQDGFDDASRRARAAFEAAGDPRGSALVLANEAFAAVVTGRHELGARLCAESAARTRAVGAWMATAQTEAARALCLARRGEHAEATAVLRRARANATVDGAIECDRVEARIELEAGRPEEALVAIDRVFARPERVTGLFEPEALALRARARVGVGRFTEARADATRALELHAQGMTAGDFESEIFLAACEAGVPGALARGLEALAARAATVGDPEARRALLEDVPANARLRALDASLITQRD